MNLIVEIIRSAIPSCIPILLAALGGLYTWHADIFNISMEGMLLTGAFTAVLGSYYTGSWFVGILAGIAGAMLISLLFGFFVFKMSTGEFITGIAINTFALGATTYLLRAIFNVKGSLIDSRIAGIPSFDLPLVDEIPVIGKVVSGHSIIVYIVLLLIVPLSQMILDRTRFGLRLKATGQNAKVVESLGISSLSIRFKSILICGVLCGIGGAFLSLGHMTMFTENMSNGRGWISLATIIVTKGRPLPALGVSLLFGLMEGLALILQNYNIASQITSMLPYVAVLVVLFFNSKSILGKRDKGKEMAKA